MGSKNRGIYNKFVVTRTDDQDQPGTKHDGCQYFVLDVTHDPYAMAALEAYAEFCEDSYSLLATDIRARWLSGEDTGRQP